MINLTYLKKNPGLIKLELLTQGINFPKDIKLTEFESSEKYIYDSYVNTDFILPSEIILPNNVVSNIYLNPTSNWSIKERKLYYIAEEVCNIIFTPEAKFSKKILSDGTPASEVAVMYGLDVFAVHINRFCNFADTNRGCHFCSSEYTQKKKQRTRSHKITKKQLAETFKCALELDRDFFKYVMITSGAYADLDNGIIDQIDYIKIMKREDTTRNFHLVTLPPLSLELLTVLASEGPDTVAFDIEVFDPNLFQRYCPGKEKYIGYDKMLKLFEEASKIFGKNRIKAGLVCGLESVKTLTQGMDFFGRLGIASSLNIFHPDEGTKLAHMPRPSRSYLLEVLSEQNRINKKYDLIPIFPEFGRRSSLDTEVYRGFFDGF